MGRKNKSIYIILIIVLLICVTIGYAVINTTLNINGKSSVSKNTWNIYFDNIQIKNGSTGEVKTPTISDQTTIDFEVSLNLPGDFYEFSVDVVNDGTIDAMIDSITKTPDLTSSQQKYLNYIIEYQNGEQITTKQLVKKEEFVRLKVRVEYRKDITSSDLPTVTETLNLGFNVNYVQSDGTGNKVSNHGIIAANGDINEIGTIVTIGTEKFYTIGTEGDNVKLLSMYNLHVGSEVTDLNLETGESTMNVISNSTGMQSSNAKGALINIIDYETEQFEYIFPWVGVTAFASEEKHGTTYSDYEGSIVEEYVDSYASLLESKFDIEIEEARLITKEELTDSNTFACSEDSDSCLDSPYPWIYSTSYWTGSALDANYVWYVYCTSLGYSRYYSGHDLGVRPVIVISKSLF